MKNNMYEMPSFDFSKVREYWGRAIKDRLTKLFAVFVVLLVILGLTSGILSAGYIYNYFYSYVDKMGVSKITQDNTQPAPIYIYTPQTTQEEAVISVVKEYSPAVVSIIISKDVPIVEEYFYNPFGEDSPFDIQVPGYRQKGTEKQKVGGGTGFLVSQDGLIITNKHVVMDDDAEYTIFTNDGKKYPAKVIAKDPVQDLALIRIEASDASQPFPTVKLGDSDSLQIGQSVIAIGNALGEFRNTVSVGVISGLQRTVSASGRGNFSEVLEDIIQTDAAINPGNSGGPLLNLKGEVIGINTAVAELAQSIGFAIPINKAKRDIDQVTKNNKITYPFLGIRYILIDQEIKEKNKLPVDYGAWVQKGSGGEAAVTKGSAAHKAGIKNGDIILELNGEKITERNSLAKIILKYNPDDQVLLKVLREKEEMDILAILGDRPQ